MSGQVVKQTVIPHSCSPGWRWEPITEESGIPPLVPGGKGGQYGSPPVSRDYPKGTVWRCDCGQHWVSRGEVNTGGWMLLSWRKERRWERWRRERRRRERRQP